jgi:hypothetical protein
MIKKIILIFLVLYSVDSFSQDSVIPLLLGFHYEVDNNFWEISSDSSTTPYRTRYVLKSNKPDILLKIDAMDYKLKNSLHSDLPLKKRTVKSELKEIKEAFSTLQNRSTNIHFSELKEFNEFTVISVIISSKEDSLKNVIIPLGFRIIEDYLVIGFAIEKFSNSTPEIAESILTQYLNCNKR